MNQYVNNSNSMNRNLIDDTIEDVVDDVTSNVIDVTKTLEGVIDTISTTNSYDLARTYS